MDTTQMLLTADDLLRISADSKRCELIKRELIEMAPSGARRANASAGVAASLSSNRPFFAPPTRHPCI